MNKKKLTIIKVGGKIVEDDKSLKQLLIDFSTIAGLKILVHGGGRSATKLADKLGIETKFINGRRITDLAMLEIVTMVYGSVNKNITAKLQALNVNAVGLTGADMDIIRSQKREVANDIDYGYVGDVKWIKSEVLQTLLDQDIVPILAPLTHDGKGNMLNTNADTIAAEVAQSLAYYYDVSLIYCFEKKGVLRNQNDENSVIYELNQNDYKNYINEGIINDGMIPKLDNAFASISKGVKEVIITKADNICKGGGTLII